LSIDIPDLHDSPISDCLELNFIKLANADDIRVQSGDEVDTNKSPMFTILVAEQYGPQTFDLHHRPISKLDRPLDVAVEVGERRWAPRHMISGDGVKYPPAALRHLLLNELGEHPILHKVHTPFVGGEVLTALVRATP
jgi:hypothetical protein